MVDALMERQLRTRMDAAGIADLPVLPEGRPSTAPTTPRVLEVFSGVVWHEFERGQDLVSFPVQLTPLQQQLLQLLQIGKEAYC